MSDFKAKIHQICRLGLCPKPHWAASPDLLAGFKGPSFKEREMRGEGEREGRVVQGKGRGKSASPFQIPRSDTEGLQ